MLGERSRIETTTSGCVSIESESNWGRNQTWGDLSKHFETSWLSERSTSSWRVHAWSTRRTNRQTRLIAHTTWESPRRHSSASNWMLNWSIRIRELMKSQISSWSEDGSATCELALSTSKTGVRWGTRLQSLDSWLCRRRLFKAWFTTRSPAKNWGSRKSLPWSCITSDFLT